MRPPAPIACTLSPDDRRARRDDLIPGLAARAESIEHTPGGVRLRMPPSPDALVAITRVVDAERHCCRFLSFTITIEPDFGPITLTITAPPEAQELLAAFVTRSDVD
ncbi:MAG TPA: hypothetical protein VMO26_25245 [Vicinamibacterales bacterium]|nr:hypothetical protein [Vicinamibacterales bacterium]